MEYKLDELESWKLTSQELKKEIDITHKILNNNNISSYDDNGDLLTIYERLLLLLKEEN